MKHLSCLSAAAIMACALLVSCASAPPDQSRKTAAAASPSPAPQASPEPAPPPQPARKAVRKEIQVQVPQLTREEVRYADGTLIQSSNITYDPKGNILKEELFNQKKSLVFAKTSGWSADGLTQTVTTVNQGGEVQGITVRQLDARGRVLKETLLNGSRAVESISEYSWDEDGNPVSWVTRKPDNSVVISTRYKLRNGRIGTIELLDDKDNPIQRFEQLWNDQGQLVKKTALDPSGAPGSVVEYRYQGKSLVREDYSRADGTLVRSIEYSYNDKGAPFQVQYLDRRGKPTEIHKQEFQFFTHAETITVYE
jgi:hypothetical protein